MLSGWEIVEDNSTRHVLPIDDIKAHEMTTTCNCDPRVEFAKDNSMIVVHMAFDLRHIVEELLS